MVSQGIRLVLGFAAFVSLFFTPASSADLISVDNEFGIGAGTFDDTQNLEFLDVTFTTNYSYDEMINTGLGIGGTFEGWRYATRVEVLGLVTSYGLPSPTLGTNSSYSVLALEPILDLIGRTFSMPGGMQGTSAMSSDTSPDGQLGVGFIQQFTPNEDIVASSSSFVFSSDYSDEYVGHYLVRYIPSPSTISLLAFAGVLSTRRRR